MKMNAKFAGVLVAAVAFSNAALASIAGPTNPPGERAGLDLASPLPEGVYFLDIGAVGSWRSIKGDSGFDYNVPLIAWSTPWTILGGRVAFLGAVPEISAESRSPGVYARGLYNPFVAGEIAWSLGNGFSISYLTGAYVGVSGSNLYANGALLAANPFDQATFQQQVALAWHGDGWNATANLIYDIIGDSQSVNILAPVPKKNADFFTYDLGLTKTLGKWEIGVIAYGSVGQTGSYVTGGVTVPYAGSGYGQFALGGLLGYNFGPVVVQFSVATDLYAHDKTIGYGGAGLGGGFGWPQKETRGQLHVIIPLWNPEAPKAVVAKY